jgi:ribosomal protein S18 acetylase RimI-like enzyme
MSGKPVGTARLSLDAHGGAIHGFAVVPELQGRGIGRQALRQFCRLLRADGAEQVRLEVAVENERALGLYTSVGFEPVTTEDYYALPAAPPA